VTFLEQERLRLIAARDRLFRDPGKGMLSGIPREFVLSEAGQNLWGGIRDDAIEYFRRCKINWWGGDQDDPTGHLLSSQVACVNHLYGLRQRQDAATALLQNVDDEVESAEIVDDGFVEFEFIGERRYLKERGFTRGAHCTSVDAAMLGRTRTGERRMFLIEWKYTETYSSKDLYIQRRAAVYDALIEAADSPFQRISPRDLYFEPFYQLMRQTLLGHQIVCNEDHRCKSFRHVHVAPKGNVPFHRAITAPALRGANVYEAWRAVLKYPESFITRTPQELLGPALVAPDLLSLSNYLRERYWVDEEIETEDNR
jgi:hypothetical protein